MIGGTDDRVVQTTHAVTAEPRLVIPADLRFILSGRGIERHRAEIRELLPGYDEAGDAAAQSLSLRALPLRRPPQPRIQRIADPIAQ